MAGTLKLKHVCDRIAWQVHQTSHRKGLNGRELTFSANSRADDQKKAVSLPPRSDKLATQLAS